MLGAIAGDIIGSIYEWDNVKTTDFPLFKERSHFTDDTVMTLAVAKWLLEDDGHSSEYLVKCMRELGQKYFGAGYGGRFRKWLVAEDPKPYHSYGNGSAMRVSPVALYADSLEEALELAKISASVSHNHREGIWGAQAVAACIYMNKTGQSKEEIKKFVIEHYGYNLNRTIDEIRPDYRFDVTCTGSVPQAIIAFLEGRNCEETIRLAISIGGDSDTIACIAASIAAAGKDKTTASLSKEIEEECIKRLPDDLRDILERFERLVEQRA